MSVNVKLEEILNSYKVGELKELAKISGVTGYSKLKKAELIEVVAGQLQSVDTTAIELPAELQDVLTPVKAKEEAASTQEPKTEAKKSNRSSAPIIGVAPHVMNVMQENQPSSIPYIKPVGSKKVYPNDPCPCGSGRKYKKCCGKR